MSTIKIDMTLPLDVGLLQLAGAIDLPKAKAENLVYRIKNALHNNLSMETFCGLPDDFVEKTSSMTHKEMNHVRQLLQQGGLRFSMTQEDLHLYKEPGKNEPVQYDMPGEEQTTESPTSKQDVIMVKKEYRELKEFGLTEEQYEFFSDMERMKFYSSPLLLKVTRDCYLNQPWYIRLLFGEERRIKRAVRDVNRIVNACIQLPYNTTNITKYQEQLYKE